MPIAPMNMVDTMRGLAALSGQQEANKQQAIKTKEFLDTHNNRVKQANADLALKAQEAEMKQESNTALQEQGLHVKEAVAGSKAKTQKSETEEKAALRKEQWYDYTAITNDSTHKQAVMGRIAEGESLEDIYADIGEYFDPDLIKSRAAAAVDSPATIAAQGLQAGKDAAALERTEIDAAARITAAQIALQGQMAVARARAKSTSANGLFIDPNPKLFSNNDFSLAAITEDLEKGWPGFKKVDATDPTYVANTHQMAKLANDMFNGDVARWNAALQQGTQLPENMNPWARLEEYSRRAEAVVMGRTRPGANVDAADHAAAQAITLDVVKNPRGQGAKDINLLQSEFGLTFYEAVQHIAKRRREQREAANGR